MKVGDNIKGLFDTVKDYSASNSMRFHMPSHNGALIGIDTSMDITELSFSDNLLSSEGIIANTEQKIAKCYHVDYALMLTCGATAGIAIAVNTAREYGDIIAVVGKAHISLYNAVRVQNMRVVEVDTRAELDRIDGDISAVFVTSPNYFGQVTDAKSWRVDGALLIVDESHGAHFPFSSKLPNSQCQIADILISSWHKALPVLTGGAVVVCRDEYIYRQLNYSRKLIHSTSPNYMIMASMDRAVDELITSGEASYIAVLRAIERFSNNLSPQYSVIDNDDKTRLCICLKGISGAGYASELEKHGVYIEMTYNDILVLIVTPYNYGYLDRLLDILDTINYREPCKYIVPPILERVDTVMAKVDYISVDSAIGRVAMSEIGIYPPGVPIIRVGDILNDAAIRFITENIDSIFGLVSGRIAVVRLEN